MRSQEPTVITIVHLHAQSRTNSHHIPSYVCTHPWLCHITIMRITPASSASKLNTVHLTSTMHTLPLTTSEWMEHNTCSYIGVVYEMKPIVTLINHCHDRFRGLLEGLVTASSSAYPIRERYCPLRNVMNQIPRLPALSSEAIFPSISSK